MKRDIRIHLQRTITLMLAGLMLLPAAGETEEAERIPLRDLLPSTSRWFRGLSLEASDLDQMDRLFDGESDLEGRPNPDSHLRRFALSLDLSKVIWSSKEIVAAYSLAADKKIGKYVDADLFRHHYADRRGSPLEFFARARRGDGLRRFASAWKLSVGLSERQTPSVPMNGDDDYEETYAAMFDPKRLVLGADDAVTAYKGLVAYTKVHRTPSGLPPCATSVDPKTGLLACSPLSISRDPVRQLKQRSGLDVKSAAMAALIPTIRYETIDQFDFLRHGGTLVRDPLVEDALDAWTVTWSLDRALNSASQRRSAIEALSLHQELVEADFSLSQPLAIRGMSALRLCSGGYVQHRLESAYAFGGEKWSTPASNGGLFVAAGTRVLAGVPDPVGAGPGGEVEITVCLEDGAQRRAGETWKFSGVRPCRPGQPGTAGVRISTEPAACREQG